MKHRTMARAAFVLALALVAGLLPGMGMAACALDDDSIPYKAYQLTVYKGGDKSEIVPVDGYRADLYTRAQFVIPATALSEMNGAEITGMTFHEARQYVNWGAIKFDVYVGEVEQATISAYADTSRMTQVVSKRTFSVENYKMAVTFDAPYRYNGGNLLIDFSHNSRDGNANGNYSQWYGQSVEGASISSSDYNSYDNIKATQWNFIPKVTFDYRRPDTTATAYTLTIPATLEVKNVGWNPSAGISATGKLREGELLSVQATSSQRWNLKSGDNYVYYMLAREEGDTKATTMWEFDSLDETEPTIQPMGVIVDENNFMNAAPGYYTDTVTFKAQAVSADQPLKPLMGDGVEFSVTVDNFNGDSANFNLSFKEENGSFTCTKFTRNGEEPQRTKLIRETYGVDFYGDIPDTGYDAIAWLEDGTLKLWMGRWTIGGTTGYVYFHIAESRYVERDIHLTSIVVNGEECISNITGT